MADFFSRLVERTLGMAPVITPLIAPMTAPGPTLAAAEPAFQKQLDEADVLAAAPSQSAELPALSASRDDPTPTKSTGASALPPRRMAISDSTAIPVLCEPSSYNPGVRLAASTDSDRQPPDDNALPDYHLPKHGENPIRHQPPEPAPPFQVVTSTDNDRQARNDNALPDYHLPKRGENPIRQQPPEPAPPSVSVPHPIQALLEWMEPEPLRPQIITPKTKVTEENTGSASPAILQADTHETHPARKVFRPSEPMTVHPVTAPYREPMPSESRRMEQESPSSSPTVRVTIGRIEVRAVMAPAPPPPQRSSPAAPRLSLEAYLKQRDGGRR